MSSRSDALARAVDPRRVSSAEREHQAFTRFCVEHSLAPSTEAVTLYLTSLLTGGAVHGRGLRYRLQLLDVHARLAGEVPWSHDRDMRRFLRGMHRQAALTNPERGVEPLHREALLAVIESLSRPTPAQVRDSALLLLANATSLPATALHDLRWEHVRFHSEQLVLEVPPMPRKGVRSYSPLSVAARRDSTCPVRALWAWRLAVGPANGPLWRWPGEAYDVGRMQPVVRLLGPPVRPPKVGTSRLPVKQVERLLSVLRAPGPREVRDRALLLVSFAAALGTEDVIRLRQRDIQTTSRGLVIDVTRRRYTTAVPSSRGGECPVDAWMRWLALLGRKNLASPSLPAFMPVRESVVYEQPVARRILNSVVQRGCAEAGLRGNYTFGSVRSGFLRTAARAGAPEHLIAEQAGIVRLHTVSMHVHRENLVRHNVAGLVGL